MADAIYVLGEGGLIIKMEPPLPEAIEDRLTKGYLKRVNADGSAFVDAETVEPTKPPVSAPKADWVGWAVHCGADPEAADGMTKADLIEKYGA